MSGACILATACVLLIGGPVHRIGEGSLVAQVELVQTQRGYAVTYRNALVKSLTVEEWTVDLPGMTVTGAIESRGGDAPDDLVVTPPAGWWCDPCAVTVGETDIGRVDLWPEVSA